MDARAELLKEVLAMRGHSGVRHGDKRYTMYMVYEDLEERVRDSIKDAESDEVVHQRGKADWLYDDEFDMHIPCCTQLVTDPRRHKPDRPCHQGPLVGEQIATGDCGEHG